MPPSLPGRAMTCTSAAYRPIRRSAGSTIPCSRPSFSIPRRNSRASCFTSSPTRRCTSRATRCSTNPSPRRWKRRACGAGSSARGRPRSARPTPNPGADASNSTPSLGNTGQGSPPSTSAPSRSRKGAPERSACSPSWRTNTGRSGFPGAGSPATIGCLRAERTTRCSLRSRATRSSCPRSARSLRKSGAILRPSMTQRAVWRDSRNPSATRGLPLSRAPRLTERQHDVLLERRALLQPLVVGLDFHELGTLYLQRIPAVDEGAERNVAHGEGFPGDIVAPLEGLLEHLERVCELFRAFVDRLEIALLGRRSDQAPEDRRDRGRDGARRPVHPAVGIGALPGVVRPERACAVLRRKVANDRVRLPQDAAVVLDRRHPAVRVHLAVEGLVDDAELQPGVGALVGNLQLFERPQHLLHVDRIDPAPELQHDSYFTRGPRREVR